jgi:DNA replication and repair protein RecF
VRLDVIAVEDLRRHRRQTIQPAAAVTAIVGPNGIGKTTLLEAAHLAMTGISFTGTPTGELIRHGCDTGAIELRAVAGGAPTEVTITLRARRSISLDGTRADGPALRRRFACIPFLPDALDLIKRGPTVRRTMLDRAIINGWPAFEEALREYRRVLDQRNALLRRLRGGGDGRDLEAWDLQLVPLALRITETRRRYLDRLAPLVRDRAERLGLGERLVAEYVPNAPTDSDAAFIALAEHRHRDIERGSTGIGPHLDDVNLTLGARAARRGASQGEQRLGVLALLLAEAALTEESRGEPPILLLDDVLSELDGERRARLLDVAREHGQVLLTATDPVAGADLIVDLGAQAVAA